MLTHSHSRSEMDQSQGRYVNFRLLYLITQLIGTAIIILIASWIGLHLGGFSWDYENPKVLFNFHPIFMTIGMVFLYGNCELIDKAKKNNVCLVNGNLFSAILVYRGFRYGRKKSLKITHATIHALAFFFTVYGLIAAFDSHNYAKIPIANLYSLHSWIGLLAVIIFAGQYVAGFTFYLFPMLKEPYRVFYMPIHIFFGLFGFVLAVAATLMGLSEKAFFAMPGSEYSDLPNQGLIVNCIGLLVAIYGALVVYMVTEKSYKREPLPEDTMLLTGNDE